MTTCRATITCSRKCRDRLMCLDSLSRAPPSIPVRLMRSEPARSTKCSLERRTVSPPTCRHSTRCEDMAKKQCLQGRTTNSLKMLTGQPSSAEAATRPLQ